MHISIFGKKKIVHRSFQTPKKLCKGHCSTLFQITDHDMLRCWLYKEHDVGKVFNFDELEDEWENTDIEISSAVSQKAYKIGRKHTPFTHLLRGLLWRKKFWNSKKFNKWLDEFKPECIFLSFSNDYFIPEIAMYVSEKYGIPIVSSIGDDYYFNKHFSLNPIYCLYKDTFRSTIRKVLSKRGSAIYISDKIRDKYNHEFGLDGETVYLTSNIKRKPFGVINREKPIITYFGNIRMGRNKSLNEIGYALGKINPEYKLEVYSGELDKEIFEVFEGNPILFMVVQYLIL